MTSTNSRFVARLAAAGLLLLGVRPDGLAAAERAVRKEVVVAAPIAEVWRAWTTEDGLRFVSQSSNVDLRIGGAYEWFLDLPPDAQGRRGGEGAQILALLAPEMLAFTWTFPPTVPELRAAGETTQVVVRLEAQGEHGTRVRLDQTGWRSGAAWDAGFAYFDTAWSYVMDALRKRYEGSE